MLEGNAVRRRRKEAERSATRPERRQRLGEEVAGRGAESIMTGEHYRSIRDHHSATLKQGHCLGE